MLKAKKMYKLRPYFGLAILTAILVFISPTLFAGEGLGDVAQNMMEPVGLFNDFISTACFVIGGSFLFATIIKYREHRRSPLLVPISTVIFLLIAGIILIALPFLSYAVNYGVKFSFFQ